MAESSPSSSDGSADVFRRIDRDGERYLDELREYLRIPSISTDSAYAGEVSRCCDFLVDHLRNVGLDARRIETGRHPLIYGERCRAPGRPTVLFYGHYDVQPAEPVEEWRHPPFEPTIEGDHLIARGATDDKGQSFTHLKAVEALLAERGELPVNVKFLIEGEEESGGESVEEYVRADGGATLGCDAVLISDGDMYAPGQPSVLYGLRGISYFGLVVRGPGHDLHSGRYGGAVANPAEAVGRIVASLQDPRTGKVLIPGFYDRVRPLAEDERRRIAGLPFDAGAYARDLGVPELVGEQGWSTLERLWARPSFDVHGLWGGYAGAGAKTVLPATAGAKVSMRLVPDQDPDEIAELFRRRVRELTPPGVGVEIDVIHGARPLLIDCQGSYFEAVTGALEDVWGRPPVAVRDGGSLPIVSTFAEVLEAPILLVGFGLPDDRPHAPNEKFNLSHFDRGIRTTVRWLDRLAAGVPAAG